MTIAILRANRIGQANRCVAAAKNLIKLLAKQLAIRDPLQRSFGRSSAVPKIVQHAEGILGQLTAKRHFVDFVEAHGKKGKGGRTAGEEGEEGVGGEGEEGATSFNFDPRFLVFEFTWNILLRKKQVEIVLDFMASLDKDQSKVKQMIMGAGKTTVVAPLLALMLADGESLVLSVVPRALVEMSRTRKLTSKNHYIILEYSVCGATHMYTEK